MIRPKPLPFAAGSLVVRELCASRSCVAMAGGVNLRHDVEFP
jgi:hypothetical protein